MLTKIRECFGDRPASNIGDALLYVAFWGSVTFCVAALLWFFGFLPERAAQILIWSSTGAHTLASLGMILCFKISQWRHEFC